MTTIAIERIVKGDKRNLSVFGDAEHLSQQIRERAFDCFQTRLARVSHELDDWLRAEQEFNWPRAEFAESPTGYNITVELPGCDAADVRVTATGTELVLCAKAVAPLAGEKATDMKVRWSEFRAGDICRVFALPGPIDVERVSATTTGGMLKIIAPKSVAKAVPVPLASAA